MRSHHPGIFRDANVVELEQGARAGLEIRYDFRAASIMQYLSARTSFSFR
jgi:hypothetical protein